MAEVNGNVKAVESEEGKEKKEVKENKEVKEVESNNVEDNEKNKTVEEEKKPEVIPLEPAIRAKKIKRQIEYYFGDFNLPTDKFLREKVKEKDGWVPLELLLKFKRLASLTDNIADIGDALTGSELIQISEDKTEIRRNPDKPLPEENEARRKEILARSVYVKGFPQEGFVIDNALDFFEQFGPTDDVVMRFYQDKAAKIWVFKGSVFVKFPTKEAAAAFLAKEEVKYGDTPLIKMWQDEYIEKKRKERLDQRMLKRKRPEEDTKGKPEETGLAKNATLHMTKCPESMTREMVKERVEEMGVVVAFIDYNKGESEGWIRLHEEGTAATVMKECEGGVLKLKDGLEIEVRLLEGEEEAKFLEEAVQNIHARRNKGGRQKARRGGGRGNRGGGNWRKFKRHDDSGEPRAKSLKTDENSGDDGE